MSWINDIINDTLKRPDPTQGGKLKWSRTSLTMASSWASCVYVFIHQFIVNKEFNNTAFGLMVGVALGSKVTDAWSKKMNPDKTPDDEPKQA